MVRLNKHSLDNEQLERLLQQLGKSFARASTSEAQQLLEILLGPEERIMVAKRLGAILLLNQDHKPYTISRLLKMSPTTVSKIQSDRLSGTYQPLLETIKKDKRVYQSILRTINSVMTAGGIMPVYGKHPENIK